MITPFQLLQDEWVMLAPLGDHPHALGIQRIDAAKRYGRAIADPGEPILKLSTYTGANLGSAPPKLEEENFTLIGNRPSRGNVMDQ